MKSFLHVMLFGTLLIPSFVFAKGELSCYEEPGTHKTTCINEKAITANGTLRGAALYSGGPNGVNATGHKLIVDCKNSVSVLQDAQGVNFGASLSSTETSVLRSLTQWMCAVKSTKPDKRLRQ